MTDPHHQYDQADYSEEGSPHSVWGEPPAMLKRRRRWEGCYETAPYSARGRFGAREFGSTVATGVLIQPIVLATSAVIELLAERAYPGHSAGQAGLVSYFMQMTLVMAMKSMSGLLRSYGASMVRDFAAWMWMVFVEPLLRAVKGVIAPDADSVIDGDAVTPDNASRRPVLDWLFPRRKRRKGE